MKKNYNWGYVGLGWIANHTVKTLQSINRVKVLACGARTPGTAKEFAEKYNIPKFYTSYEEMADDQELDIVYICTPVNSHKELAELFMNRGKHVICEKPMTRTAEEIRSMEECSNRNGTFCMEAMWTRFFPALQELQKIIKGGMIGEVRLVQANYSIFWPFDPEYHLYRLDMGGSTMLDQGIYPLTIASIAFDSIPVRQNGLANLKNGVDLRSGSVLGFKNGGIAVITTGADIPGNSEAVVFGENGWIKIPECYHPDMLIIHNNEDGFELKKVFPYEGTGYQFEFEEAMKCIDEGRTQSSIVPLSLSEGIIDTITALRKEWGVIYPDEIKG